MNRAVCLMRPEPLEADLQATGEAIVHAAPPQTLKPLSQRPAASAAAAAGSWEGEQQLPPAPPAPPPLARSTSLGSDALGHVLRPLAAAYHQVYHKQRELSQAPTPAGAEAEAQASDGGETVASDAVAALAAGPERDFVGMRDYYSMLRMLRAQLLEAAHTADALAKANPKARFNKNGAHQERGVFFTPIAPLCGLCHLKK